MSSGIKLIANVNTVKSSSSYKENSHQWPQIFAIFVVSLGSLTSGVQFAWTSPSIPILTSNSSHLDPMTTEAASYLAVIPAISLGITSPFVGLLLECAGRKKTAMFMTIPQFLSWLLIGLAGNIYVLYLSRFLSGIGFAVFFSALPTYVAEIAVPYVRGMWGNVITISTFFGQLLINVIGTRCDIRTTAIIFGCVPVLQMVLLFLLPESPYYLLMKNKEEDARDALRKLRWMENVDEELASIRNDVRRQVSESGTLKDLLTSHVNRKALIICAVVRGIQQFSGLPAFATYTLHMFNQVGGNFSPSTSAIVYCAMWTVSITVAAYFVGKFGRRPLLMFSCLGCCVILAVEGTYFYLEQETGVDVSKLNWLPLMGLLIYIAVCSVGLGILPTLLLGEMFSVSVKGKALTVINICFAVYTLVVPKVFQVLTTYVGMYAPFYLFSGCCFAGLVFAYFYVVETRGKTLEEIQQVLRNYRN